MVAPPVVKVMRLATISRRVASGAASGPGRAVGGRHVGHPHLVEAADVDEVGLADRRGAAPADDERCVAMDLGVLVDLHELREVALGDDTHELGALLVVEGQLVAAAALGRGAAPPGGLGRGLRERVRRRIGGVEEAPDHQRVVAVAVKMGDQDLAPDARERERAVPRAGPLGVDASPERLGVR